MVTAEDILRAAAAALSACNVNALTTLYADDAIFEDVPSGESYRGKAAIRSMFVALFAPASTQFRVTAVRPAEGGGVLEWTWSGRTRKTGAPFDVRGVSVLELSGSTVSRETIYYDPRPALV